MTDDLDDLLGPKPVPADPAAKVQNLYRLALARDPKPDESRFALQFLDAAATSPGPEGERALGPWERLAQVLLMSNEFAFAD